MKTYLVFEPAGGIRNSETAEKIVFLREKFSWPALFFTPIWLLWHRLWLAFVLWLLASAVIAALTQLFDLSPAATVFALLLPNALAGFEASELRRRKLLRKGFNDAGVVMAEDIEDAEQRFFEEWVKAASETPSAPSTPSAPVSSPPARNITPAPGNPVIGLFPEPGARA